MNSLDEIALANQRLWEDEVKSGCGYTRPWLEIDTALLQQYVQGQIEFLPEPMGCIHPAILFSNVAGKDVLCLAAGGGQQSAIFGLLGAKVTVVDLTEGQLAGDRQAAAHYGYAITTFQADMRDLSILADHSFDLVFQANSMAYIPNVRQVYTQVARVLRPHGLYRVVHGNPATASVQWDGAKYHIAAPYRERVHHREDGGIEFRHYMDDIFQGLLEAGFSLKQIYEEPYAQQDSDEPEGSWNHERTYVGGGFVIVARK